MTFLSDSIRIANLNPRNYKKEIIIGFFTFLLTSWLPKIHLNIPSWLTIDQNELPLPAEVVRVIVWVWIFWGTKILWDGIEEVRQTRKHYKFDPNDWPNNWIFHGEIHLSSNKSALIIENSGSGCLLKSHLWKDFDLTFEAKFLDYTPGRSFGVLIRAENLESYYMLELRLDSKKLFVKPHVRVLGQWEYTDYKEIINKDFTDYFHVKITLKNRSLDLYINALPVYSWALPDQKDFRGKPRENPQFPGSSLTVQEVSFTRKHGMLGFRADYGQGAEIRDIEIKAI